MIEVKCRGGGMQRKIPETAKEFYELLPNIEVYKIIESMNYENTVHGNYRISIKGNKMMYSLAIGTNTYGNFEIGDGKKGDVVGCDTEEELIKYMNKHKGSIFGVKKYYELKSA